MREIKFLVQHTWYIVAVILLICLLPTAQSSTWRSDSPEQPSRETLLDAVNKTTAYNSDSYVLKSPYYAVYTKWVSTGTVDPWSGTIQLQASMDNVNWKAIASTDVVMYGSGSTYWNVSDAGYLYGRVSIATYTAGSANLTIVVNKK